MFQSGLVLGKRHANVSTFTSLHPFILSVSFNKFEQKLNSAELFYPGLKMLTKHNNPSFQLKSKIDIIADQNIVLEIVMTY